MHGPHGTSRSHRTLRRRHCSQDNAGLRLFRGFDWISSLPFIFGFFFLALRPGGCRWVACGSQMAFACNSPGFSVGVFGYFRDFLARRRLVRALHDNNRQHQRIQSLVSHFNYMELTFVCSINCIVMTGVSILFYAIQYPIPLPKTEHQICTTDPQYKKEKKQRSSIS